MTAPDVLGFDALIAAADYPVVVVTTRVDAQRAGCLVGFTAQMSIEPRRFLVGISKKNHTYRLATRAEYLAVHVLDRRQLALAALFGTETGDDVDKFTHCEWHSGPASLPILEAAAGWFCGRIVARYDFGDHVGMLLAPEGVSAPSETIVSLRYRDTMDFTPGHQA